MLKHGMDMRTVRLKHGINMFGIEGMCHLVPILTCSISSCEHLCALARCCKEPSGAGRARRCQLPQHRCRA